MARSRRSKDTKITVNFKGVEGKRPLVDEGEFLVRVDEVTRDEGDAGEYWKWVFEIKEGDFEGSKLYYNTSLSKDSLWNLKSLLEALGQDVPDDEMDIDLEDMVDLEMMVNVEHEKYNGKNQARVVDFWPAEEDKKKDKNKKRGEREERGSRKNNKKKDKIAQEEVEKMDEEELEDLVKEQDLPVDLDDFRTLTKKKNAVIDALEKEDLLEE